MPRFDQSKFVKRANVGVKAALASPDHVLVQTVSAIDELTKMSNLAYERIVEWYGLHFPEFKQADPAKYVQVAQTLDRQSMDEAALTQILGTSAPNVIARSRTSSGVAFSPADFSALREHTGLFFLMKEKIARLEKYRDEAAQKLAPNISHLAGPALAAKLIAQAGGLSKLASFPASTVQVIGAEKALFKHLRSGSPPPKHGLIFQHVLISMSPKRARGKIARALAAKIAIASKADAYSHNFIAEKLKEQFEARAKAILASEAARPADTGRPGGAPRPGPGSQNRPQNFAGSPKPGPQGNRGHDPQSGGQGNRPPFGQGSQAHSGGFPNRRPKQR